MAAPYLPFSASLAERQDAIAAVRAVYADLARRPVMRDCIRRTQCCQFKLTGRAPVLTRSEALVAAAGLRASGRKRPPVRSDGACPMLEERTGKCIIYDSRPFGCRTHFCRAAGGPYTRKEVADLIRRLEEADAALGYRDGSKPLEDAMEDVLK